MDEVSRRIKIRITALGFSNLKAFYEIYVSEGGTRSYHWWRSLDGSSSYNDLREAATCLGVSSDVLLGEAKDSDTTLIREGVDLGRVKLHG